MIQQNIVFLVIKAIFFDTLRDIIRFPFWWYTTGLKRVFFIFINSVRSGEESLALSIWVKNIWRPMYGQYDLIGRLVSIFIRITQIIIRAALFIIWVYLSFVLVVFWVAIPVVILLQIIYQIKGLVY